MSKKFSVCFFVIGLDSNFRGSELLVEISDLGIPTKVVNAVEGSSLKPDLLKNLYSQTMASHLIQAQLTLGEVGCALSHQLAYRSFLDSPSDFAIILEDDVRLSAKASLYDLLEFIQKHNYFFQNRVGIHLGGIFPKKLFPKSKFEDCGLMLLRCYRPPTGTYAYILNRKSAYALLLKNHEKVSTASDWPVAAQVIKWWTPNKTIFNHTDSPSLLDIGRQFDEKPSVSFNTIGSLRNLISRITGIYLLHEDFHDSRKFETYLYRLPSWLHIVRLLLGKRKMNIPEI